ncbi:MAG TPA: hypothetical protein PLE32_25045 [Haliscomenobacter sp.]|nr:hypothetical protein [Haliscomenobacter sp.]
MTAKQTLLNWLSKDDFKSILKGLHHLADRYNDEQVRNDATFQSGRLEALEKQRTKDIISLADDHLEAAKIRQALLQIINELPDDWAVEGMESISTTFMIGSKSNWKKYAAYIAAFVALFAGIAEMTGYSVRDIFQKKDTTEIPGEALPPASKTSTTGDNSPAVITHDGDVHINYGETQPKKDSTTNK